MHLSETTNGKLAEAMAMIRTMIEWAEADAEHATENDAPDTAADDRYRALHLRRALKLLEECHR
jgi:hypothetical protein